MNISIHALREEGDPATLESASSFWISIHALREEGDCQIEDLIEPEAVISIHALREEGDLQQLGIRPESWKFLSTPSARRATGTPGIDMNGNSEISIHALREEGDIELGYVTR